jgi:hypothetical protein
LQLYRIARARNPITTTAHKEPHDIRCYEGASGTQAPRNRSQPEMKTITPTRTYRTARLACMALAALVAGGEAAAAPPDGIFCISGQGARILAAAPGPAGALRFGVSLWSPQGQNFSLFGTASPAGAGWLYAPDAGCRARITLTPDHGVSVAVDAGADCREQGGAGMRVGTLAFPRRSYEGPVTDQLANAEAFQHAGRCAGGN